MEFHNSTSDDLQTIFSLYEAAIAHQQAVSDQHWLPFNPQMVADEIAEGRQWKIVVDKEIACIFVTAYSDPAIWGDRGIEPAVYLHRIVTNPAFRGRQFVRKIVEWSKIHGKSRGSKFLRLDTWSENLRLQELYTGCGFRFLGVAPPADPTGLPDHYSGISLGFYEMPID